MRLLAAFIMRKLGLAFINGRGVLFLHRVSPLIFSKSLPLTRSTADTFEPRVCIDLQLDSPAPADLRLAPPSSFFPYYF